MNETEATPDGWEPPPLSEPPKTGLLTYADLSKSKDEPPVEVAYRWSKLYEKDVEYEPFTTWIGRRSNPERTDFHEILESLPLHWGPEDLPPPLRRHFLARFGK